MFYSCWLPLNPPKLGHKLFLIARDLLLQLLLVLALRHELPFLFLLFLIVFFLLIIAVLVIEEHAVFHGGWLMLVFELLFQIGLLLFAVLLQVLQLLLGDLLLVGSRLVSQLLFVAVVIGGLLLLRMIHLRFLVEAVYLLLGRDNFFLCCLGLI